MLRFRVTVENETMMTYTIDRTVLYHRGARLVVLEHVSMLSVTIDTLLSFLLFAGVS